MARLRMKKKMSHQMPLSFSLKVVLGSVFGVIFVVILMLPHSETKGTVDTRLYSGSKIVKGQVGSVDYYHCPANPGTKVRDIVLLHGARFTKEDWKKSGILGMLCEPDDTAVTALDLSVKATYDVLFPLMQQLKDENVLAQLPVESLVTPSASGLAVSSALAQGKVNDIEKHTKLWLPIASPSILQLTNDQLQAAQRLYVFGMTGDQDEMGKQISEKLKEHAGADSMTFPGGHPFYLDVPADFSSALLKLSASRLRLRH